MPANHGRESRWNLPAEPFRWGLPLLAVAVVALHVPSLTAPHHEGDEAVFTFLAERLGEHPFEYNVRGALEGEAARRFIEDTWVHTATAGPAPAATVERLRRLDRVELLVEPLSSPPRHVFDPVIYDHPLFLHPPVYPASLALFRKLLGSAGGPLLSILTHVAAVLALAFVGRAWFGPAVGLLAGVLLAIDPVSWLAGSHVWADSMLEAGVILAVAAATWALDTRRDAAFVGAGVVFGIACATKYPAVLVAPAIATAGMLPPHPPWRRILWYGAGVTIVLLPWIILFRGVYGAWLPITNPTDWLKETYPYVKMMAARPWHFYVSGLALVAPVLAFAVPGALEARRDRRVWIVIVWAGAVLAVLTARGLAGQGFQLRYLAPALPALCLLAALGILRVRSRARWIVAGILGGVTFATALQSTRLPDPFPFVVVDFARLWRIPVERWLSGMW